jgi:hypothetical protein
MKTIKEIAVENDISTLEYGFITGNRYQYMICLKSEDREIHIFTDMNIKVVNWLDLMEMPVTYNRFGRLILRC